MLTLLDVIVIALALAAAVRGWRRGLLGQAFEFGGGFLGLVAGVVAGTRLAAAFTDRAGLEGALIALVAVLVGLTLGQVVGYFLGRRFGSFARRLRLGGVDAALGSAFGIGIALVSYWLLGSLLVQGPVPAVAEQLQRSRLLQRMNRVADPPNVLSYLRQYLDTSGFPQVFAGLPPRFGATVALPSGQQARGAVGTASASTVRVVVNACGGTQLGSGWISAASTVITNAHVVAGGRGVSVVDSRGPHEGTVVLFDPEVDLAVVRAGGLGGSPLALETSPLATGSPGATLGYPGATGGRLDPQPAAVQKTFRADGLDIYGRNEVRREVYELRARVRQGDSGGPFVTLRGKVAGVVFAASTTDRDSGYALTGAEVAGEVRRGAHLSEAVPTGRCTH